MDEKTDKPKDARTEEALEKQPPEKEAEREREEFPDKEATDEKFAGAAEGKQPKEDVSEASERYERKKK